MLASCESKWGYDRQYDIFGWKMGTTRRKEDCQMGSVVWKRRVPQKVLEKRGMKKKSVKFKLRSAEREGVKEYGMKLWSAERGGFRSGEWKWGAPKQEGVGVRNEIKESQSRQRSTDGIEECLSQRTSAEKGWGKECGLHYRSAGGNWGAPIPGLGARIGGGLACRME